MMTNLFSIFDPSSSIFSMSLNWISSLLIFIFLPLNFWLTPSRINIMFNNIIFTLHNEFYTLMEGKKLNFGNTLMFISLFSFIMFNNILGLFPYIFTSTSHMVTTMSLSLPLWLAFMFYGWSNHTQHMFSHLIPQGTPSLLMSFMVYIELISNVIRPGTLAIRLSANMIAGHLLMTLLGSTGPSLPTLLIWILLTTQILLLTLESAVALIQSYVFAILSTLYSTETN